MTANRADDGLTAKLIALGAQGERLCRRLDELDKTVQELLTLWQQFADRNGAQAAPTAVSSWLLFPDDMSVERATALLVDLAGWLDKVYLRFPDGRTGLPDCWAHHPEVIEELLWLRRAWAAAHHPKAGGASQIADWHDRMRPGVARRIRATAGICAPEAHRAEPRSGGTTAPGRAELAAVAQNWLTQRAEAVTPGMPS